MVDQQILLSTFVKNVPMNVAMFDQDLCYVAASQRWYDFYRLNASDVLGKTCAMTSNSTWHEKLDVLEQDQVLKLEEEISHDDDSLSAWMRYFVCRWTTKYGAVGGVIVFAENITEQKQVALMKNEFISTVNHELRTPLTAIQGAIGLLKMGAINRLDAKYQKLLLSSYENCQLLTDIVNDILDMEKIEAGELSYTMQLLDLNALLQNVVHLNQTYAQKYNVDIDLKLLEQEVFVSADNGRLSQVLSNLLSNACKFSHAHSKVDVKIYTVKQQIYVSVQDYGDGISKSFRHKIFQRFMQADGSSQRAKGGTGLGLSISKSMIEAMGGTIEFQTEVGEGTIFTIGLPLQTPELRQSNV